MGKYNRDKIADSPPKPDWKSIDTCILDMDGTLLDLHFDHEVWYEELPNRLAKKTRETIAIAKSRVKTITNCNKGTLNWYNLDYWHEQLQIDIDEIEVSLSHLINIRPGALEFLTAIRKRCRSIYLATNAHPRQLQRKLDATGIKHFFDHIISSHQLGVAKEELLFWENLKTKFPFENDRTLLLDDNVSILEIARLYGVKYVYGIKRPNSRGETIESCKFHLIEDYSSLL